MIPPSRTDQYKHSFFVQTAVDWNHLDENCPQRNSKVSSPRSQYIVTKSLSTRHIIAQQGSYDVITVQIQDTWICSWVKDYLFLNDIEYIHTTLNVPSPALLLLYMYNSCYRGSLYLLYPEKYFFDSNNHKGCWFESHWYHQAFFTTMELRGIWVVSLQKVSRIAPLNRYYIIIDEVFFDNFLVIIYY